MIHVFRYLSVLMIGLIVTTCSKAACGQDLVRLYLKEQIATDSQRILIRDVATIQGGSFSNRSEIGALDLIRFDPSKRKASITALQVAYRIKLAGYRQSEFKMSGTKEVIVQRSIDDVTLTRILAGIKKKISTDNQVNADDLRVLLAERLDVGVPDVPMSEVEFDISPNSKLRIGSQNITIGMYSGRNFIKKFGIRIDSRLTVNVPIAKKPIAKGEPFNFANVEFIEKEFSGKPRVYPTPENVLGKVARRGLNENAEILVVDLKATKTTVAPIAAKRVDEVIIKARQPVIVVVKRSGLSLKLTNATAMTTGKKGDLIQVRNNKSDRVITGRVLSSTEVEAIY